MLGGDPPRRPPQRNSLTRSKSCQGPTPRRKRGREVLEDITWIVNSSSSWQQAGGATAPSRAVGDDDDGVLVAAAAAAGRALGEPIEDDEQPVAGPSSARLLAPPLQSATPAAVTIQSVNMARARSETFLPSLNSNITRPYQSNSNNNNLHNAPRASISRITNLDSSSPPSSPHSSSRYGYSMGYAAGGSGSTSNNRTGGLGLSRAATLPFLTIGTSAAAGTSSTSTARRTSINTTSPSLRAPPPLRRTSSSSSVSSMDGTSSNTPPAASSYMLSAPFSGSSRTLARASTVPTFTSPWTNEAAPQIQEVATSSTTPTSNRILPIPTIQREMPSPERKRSRRGSRMIEDYSDDDEGINEESDDE